MWPRALLIIALVAACAALAPTNALRAQNTHRSPEARATAYLAAEVPKWHRENKCFSCHNNGDAARALMLAHGRGLLDDRAPLTDTLDFLRKPDKWDANGPDGPFKDEKLARIQFGLALTEAKSFGLIEDPWTVYNGARLVAELQKPDGSWPSDADGTIGSPVTYGAPLASAIALRTLVATKERKFRGPILRGTAWFLDREPQNVLDAAATILALDQAPIFEKRERCDEAITILKKAQSLDGGWGPFATSPPEVFDSAIAMIALASQHGRYAEQIAAGRKYLLAQQLPDGSWPATTRPSGADSYAQKLSTTGWALQALFVSK
jgi:hypothetical protein